VLAGKCPDAAQPKAQAHVAEGGIIMESLLRLLNDHGLAGIVRILHDAAAFPVVNLVAALVRVLLLQRFFRQLTTFCRKRSTRRQRRTDQLR
jgi:hypothetical protein